MTIHLDLIPVLSIVAGIAVLILPRQMRFILGAYLIAVGVIGMIL